MDRQLRKLDKKVQIRIARASIRAAAKPMIEAAKRLVPYDLSDPDGPDGYHLRDYIRLQLEPKRTRFSEAEFRLGPARVTTNGGARKIEGGLGPSAKAPNYAQIVERDKPFLRPAFDNHHLGFIKEFKAQMLKKITRALK
ncbi:HK97 gp10 family phage protein [uncultured Paraglaciecola sp.]|uniref:HK97 gp10 family phage protein n=1 Tax=uncultured Paraglaciecola sp. TaxID=1765024 RepID=UPI0026382F12|nr:HK97 gp10 family phage protein [uncultured Paraglaciecola sp.]